MHFERSEHVPPIQGPVVVEHIEKAPPHRPCSCIVGAREYGVPIPPNTNSWDMEPNGPALPGGLVLFSYDENDYTKDHVAAIIYYDNDGLLVFEENFNNPPGGCLQQERLIAWDDPHIRGFWHPSFV